MGKKSLCTVLVILVTFAFFLIGCGGGQAEYNEPSDEYYRQEPAEAPAEEPSSTGYNQSLTSRQQRIVIMNGEMTVRTYNPIKIVEFITQLADRYHGFVVESNISKGEATGDIQHISGRVTIRVPAARLLDAIEEIEAQNLQVVNKNVSGQDVTADYVDLKSRLSNLEQATEQLQKIMDSSTDTEAVLKVYQELVKVNEEAEIVRGQIQYYDEASTMSSLSVEVVQIVDQPEPTPTPTPEPWRLSPVFKESGTRLSVSFQYWLENVVRFFVYGLPMFILRAGPWLAGFFFLGRWGYRKYKNRGEISESEPAE